MSVSLVGGRYPCARGIQCNIAQNRRPYKPARRKARSLSRACMQSQSMHACMVCMHALAALPRASTNVLCIVPGLE